MDTRQAEYLKLLGIQAWCKQEDLPIIQAHLQQEKAPQRGNSAPLVIAPKEGRIRLQDQMASLFDERPSGKMPDQRSVAGMAGGHLVDKVPASHSGGAEQSLITESLSESLSPQASQREGMPLQETVQNPADLNVSRERIAPQQSFQVEVAPRAPEKIAVRGPFTSTPYQFPADASIYSPQFAESIQQCRGCEFSQSRHQATLPRQYPNAPVMVITDIPLKEEMYQGLVLDRADESFFYQALTRVGFKVEELYITPFIKCRPPELRDVEESEWHACYAILRQEILALQPKVIFLLGRNCVKFLLQSELPFESLRLTPHQLTFDGVTIPAVISHSPKVYARNSRLKANFWQDVKFLRRQYSCSNRML